MTEKSIRARAVLLAAVVVVGGMVLPAFDAAEYHGTPRSAATATTLAATGTAPAHPVECPAWQQIRGQRFLLGAELAIVRLADHRSAPGLGARVAAPRTPAPSLHYSRAPPARTL
jgi:hypothetical protein